MADITWRSTAFPEAQVGVAYEAGLAETGSLTAVTACAVTTGALPPGLAINADHVRITGTPTTAGHYVFTLTMTDTAGGVVSPSFSIDVVYATNDQPGDILQQPLAAQFARMWH